ncbi:MAG: Fic family protein [Bradymonadales bacterium]|nr:MAG: Fic family protein [Bradymonadales bacterium]
MNEKKEGNSPNKLLAEALKKAKSVSKGGVVKSTDLTRLVRERLIKANCLFEIFRGWYLLTTPSAAGSSTAWYDGLWAFISYYLSDRFGADGYCLSAEASLNLHVQDSVIPPQITVLTRKASNQTIDLPYHTSLLMYSDERSFPKAVEEIMNVKVMALPESICRLSQNYFKSKPLNVEIALKHIQSAAQISRFLLETNSVTAAARVVGAYEALGDTQKANQIIRDLEASGLVVAPLNPFESDRPQLKARHIRSPFVGRLEALWSEMRGTILRVFPPAPGLSKNDKKTLKIIERFYPEDAYHSLSIEGYQVTEALIKQIRDGNWDPDNREGDQRQRDALAAKGYHNAFQTVMKSAVKVLRGENSGDVIEQDLQGWYRELFSPLVRAQLLRSTDLAGYRNGQVHISNSRYIPPDKDSVPDAMESLMHLLKNEPEPQVRAILGHFIFVYIHPYMDGNGRVARFLMNLMFISGGFNWCIVRTAKRDEYMSSLEMASTKGNIEAFAKFIRGESEYWKRQLDRVEKRVKR